MDYTIFYKSIGWIGFFLFIALILAFSISYVSYNVSQSAEEAVNITQQIYKEGNSTVKDIRTYNKNLQTFFLGIDTLIETFEDYIDQQVCGYCQALPVPPIGSWTISNGLCDFLKTQTDICTS